MPRRKRQCLECRHSFIASSLLDVAECNDCAGRVKALCTRASPPSFVLAAVQEQAADDEPIVDALSPRTTEPVDSEQTANKEGKDNLYLEISCSIPTAKFPAVEETTSSANFSNVPYSNEQDDEDDRSEAADDLHCTQIIDIEDDSDDDEEQDDVPLVCLVQPSSTSIVTTDDDQTVPSEPSLVRAAFVNNVGDDEGDNDLEDEECDAEAPLVEFSVNKNNDLMLCNICGASLSHIVSGWKGRLNHIKRCAKKNQYTAKEARYNDDYEVFEQNGLNATAAATSAVIGAVNPYNATKSSAWHGGNDAKVAEAQARSTLSSRLPSAFQALMAGARRAAKIEKIKAQSPPAKKASAARGWGGRPAVDYSQHQCPAYKKIINTDFVVDGFYYAKSSLTQNYFLTHFHADHYGGITRAWKAGTIYCSIGTANLVNQQLGVDRKYLHPLPMDTATIIESRGKPVTVTLIDANHCPGAVMFLFQVGNRTTLHVGDFRWNRQVMQEQAALRPFLNGSDRIDDLYLDTTYCDAKYDLPTQQDAIQSTIQVAIREFQDAKRSKKKLLMLFGAYTIGKERIYMSVAEELGMKVYVDSRRMRILKSLDWKNDEISKLTTKSDETCIWVVPLGHINMKKLEDYLITRTGSFDRVVGFRPTGWSHTKKGGGIVTSNSRGRIAVHNVPYSEHSSFPELVDCLASLRPKRIIPTVSVSKSQQQIDLLLNNWKR